MKYQALKRHLEGVSDAPSVRLGFDAIEALLGFDLPRSARTHQAWWSNTRAGHSHAAAWLDAGWRTGALDLAGAQVSFFRDERRGLAEEASAFVRDGEGLAIALSALSPAALQMIDRRAAVSGETRGAAAAALLNEAALERRRALFAGLAQPVPPGGDDSAAIVREDRDGR
ncbi:DUF7662 domain-containing protein [Caulobacter hibisci]|uniref:DUF7662 domain-containing protein n=1 Tax=Caulobacter hibisci TaxID=2035993 RepID=A0ABS0T394_9CAUL|nr:hypothetical protein [Caulobacter hibisci]MBI1686348.1 hypothetical protein [Caulobacter hibisci]